MKLFSMMLATLFGTCLFAADLKIQCKANTVFNSNIFEEGLSPFEYPSYSIEKHGAQWKIDIGANLPFETSKGATVEVFRNRSFELALDFSRGTESTKFRTTVHLVTFYDDDGNEHNEWHSMLLFKDVSEPEGRWEPLASFKCDRPIQ